MIIPSKCRVAVRLVPALVLGVALSTVMPLSGSGGLGYQAGGEEQPGSLPAEVAARLNELTFIYQVGEGETLGQVARRYGFEEELIRAMNYPAAEGDVEPGQYLVLPREPDRVHQVSPGDTVFGLAREYDVDVEEIVRANNLSAPEVLSVGQNLVIPGRPGAIPASGVVLKSVARGSSGAAHLAVSEGWVWPAEGEITSGYGPRKDGFHHGIDIAMAEGTEIVAARGGKVKFAGWLSSVYGWSVVLEHVGGLETVYAHLRSTRVSAGDSVAQGQPVGEAGSSGRATGPHLHFEVRRDGQPIDPLSVLPERKEGRA